jgi:beta-phosphoglucomutase-like phosphatase (HAD superfamily)
LIFDMDGLLVDSEPLWYEVERSLCRDRGHSWTPEHAAACVGRGMAATLAKMGETFGFPVDLERDAAWVIDSFVGRVGELKLKPGGMELLRAARGKVPLGLASSSSHRLIMAVLDQLALAPVFDAIVSGESVPRPKPAPDIFLRTADLLGVAPASCVVLEDSIAGAQAGRAAGMTVFAVPEGPPEGRGFNELADRVLPDLFAAIDALDFKGG